MNCKQYIILLLLLSSAAINAQEQPDRMQVADKHFYKYEYAYAAPLYEKLAAKRNPKPLVLYRLAYCYDEMQQYQKALTWYTAYVRKDSAKAAGSLLRIGDILKIEQRYEEAKTAYKAYLQMNAADLEQTKIRISSCDSALRWLAQKPSFLLKNEVAWNTALSDWGATFYNNEMIFTSEDRKKEILDRKSRKNNDDYGWTGNPYLRLYMVSRSKGSGNDSAILADPGSVMNGYAYHVGPAAFSSHFDTVYFTITTNGNHLQTVRHDKRSAFVKRNLEIYYSVKDTLGKWAKPVPFAYNKSAAYSVGLVALNENGSILYFTSDKPGGYGKTDIWYCKKNASGGWDAPLNCGGTINTKEEEAFPTIGPAGQLYFSSKGHIGLGGFDLFVTTGSDSNWHAPVNLKLPYNSGYDDFYLSMAPDGSGYLSSDRPDGKGSDDIYSFAAMQQVLPPKPAAPVTTSHRRTPVLKSIVLSAKDSSVLADSRVTLTNKQRKADWVKVADDSGRADFLLEDAYMYNVNAAKEGYISEDVNIQTMLPVAGDTITAYVYLQQQEPPKPPIPYKVGDKFVLENLHYDYDKSNIRPDAAVILDKLVDILEKYPTIEIELSSHTDSRGSDAYNMALSERRAVSAVQYLIGKGIGRQRVQAKGYGETMLVNRCSNGVACSVDEHQENRRTEVTVVKID